MKVNLGEHSAAIVVVVEWILFVILLITFGMIGLHEVIADFHDTFAIVFSAVILFILLVTILLVVAVWNENATICRIWCIVNIIFVIGFDAAAGFSYAVLREHIWFIMICSACFILYKIYAIWIIFKLSIELNSKLASKSDSITRLTAEFEYVGVCVDHVVPRI